MYFRAPQAFFRDYGSACQLSILGLMPMELLGFRVCGPGERHSGIRGGLRIRGHLPLHVPLLGLVGSSRPSMATARDV